MKQCHDDLTTCRSDLVSCRSDLVSCVDIGAVGKRASDQIFITIGDGTFSVSGDQSISGNSISVSLQEQAIVSDVEVQANDSISLVAEGAVMDAPSPPEVTLIGNEQVLSLSESSSTVV